MNKIALSFFIFIFMFSLAGCSKRDDKKISNISTEDVEIDLILPQRAYFTAVRRQLKDTNWNSYIYKEGISNFKEEYGGYQVGILLTNCAFASAIKNEELVKKLSDQIISFSKKLNISDEKIVFDIIDIINTFDNLIKDENYKEISNKIQEIENILKKYYLESNDKEIIEQIKFSSWLEAFYIVSRAIKDKYDPGLSNLFNRHQEVNYFVKSFSDKKYDFEEEINSLNKLKVYTTVKRDISAEDISLIILEIETLRNIYLI